MPYIDGPKRRNFDSFTLALAEALKQGGHQKGDLNYVLSALLHAWIIGHPDGLRYGTIADAISAIECAKLEFYRQVAVPYEDEKKKSNGYVSRLDDPSLGLEAKTPR